MSRIATSLKSWFRKLVFSAPPLYLESDKEDELIEKVARAISKARIGMPVVLFGAGFESVSSIISMTFLWQISPFLELVGIRGYEYAALLNKKDNVRRLVDRIKELDRERDEKEKQAGK